MSDDVLIEKLVLAMQDAAEAEVRAYTDRGPFEPMAGSWGERIHDALVRHGVDVHLAATEASDEKLDGLLGRFFAERDAAIADVLAHRASPPEYPGLALVPVEAIDRLAKYAGPPAALPDTEVTE